MNYFTNRQTHKREKKILPGFYHWRWAINIADIVCMFDKSHTNLSWIRRTLPLLTTRWSYMQTVQLYSFSHLSYNNHPVMSQNMCIRTFTCIFLWSQVAACALGHNYLRRHTVHYNLEATGPAGRETMLFWHTKKRQCKS